MASRLFFSSSSSSSSLSSNKFFTREIKCRNVNSKHNQLRKKPKEVGGSDEKLGVDRRNMVIFIAAGAICNMWLPNLQTDLRRGDGPTPKTGDTVVIDWNKTKGGSFVDFFKFRVGSQEVIPAFEEAVSSMALGGIRRIIVPPELGYPENDYNKSGPRPTTFLGQRALDFVLKNQGLIDKTLLFDMELLKIIPN